MKVPYRPTNFIKRKYNFRYIIIHDVNCTFSELAKYMIDDKKSQVNMLRSDNYILHNQTDLNYHMLAEKVNEDFETILCRPLTVMCKYDDILTQYERSVHIGMMGSYTYEIPSDRFYRQLAYRCIVPLMGMFGITIDRIYLHREVSENKDSDCPGDFFKKTKLMANIKPMLAVKG